MIGNMRCCNNIHRGNKDLCHCSMDVSWLHDIVPSKMKFNLNRHCQLTWDDWGIPNTKLKYCQCTSAALLCCKNTQLFNCLWQIITHVWWLGIVLCIPSRYLGQCWNGGVWRRASWGLTEISEPTTRKFRWLIWCIAFFRGVPCAGVEAEFALFSGNHLPVSSRNRIGIESESWHRFNIW